MALCFAERLAEAGRDHIYWKKGTEECVNLEALERMNLHYLQRRLLMEVGEILRTNPAVVEDDVANKTNTLLHQYSEFTQVCPEVYICISN